VVLDQLIRSVEMKKRRIAITALRRRRTVVLQVEPVNLDPTTNTHIEERRDDHERKERSNCHPHDTGVSEWLVPPTIDVGAIREGLSGRTQQCGATVLEQQQLQDD
jgi:hypothetical protein